MTERGKREGDDKKVDRHRLILKGIYAETLIERPMHYFVQLKLT